LPDPTLEGVDSFDKLPGDEQAKKNCPQLWADIQNSSWG
jgi:hypothetical protein